MERLTGENLGLYELNRIDFEQTGGFYENNPHAERIYFKDPVSQKLLNPADTFSCITREDEMCARGLEWLNRSSERLNIQLLLNHHGSGRDFDAFLVHPEAGQLLQAARFVAVEANFSPSGEGILVMPRRTGYGQFQQTQMQWIARNDKLALPCEIDYPQDPTLAGGMLRQVMFELVHKSNPPRDAPPSLRQEVLQKLGNMYYQLIRENMMIGQFGYWMSEIEQWGALPDEPVDVPFMVGSFHLALAERFQHYTDKFPTLHIIKPHDSAPIYADIFRQGYVTYEQLCLLIQK